MSSEDLELEPLPGLPEMLPSGEKILWQGRPDWKKMARQTFKVRVFAAYFAVFVTHRFVMGLYEGKGFAVVPKLLTGVGLSLACLGILYALAWLNARAAVYTITTRRVAMRIGVAIPMTWNIPFKQVAAADVLERAQDDGDIALTLSGSNKIAWLYLWPHAQPWRVVKPRPTLRAIHEPARVAGILRGAVAAWSRKESTAVDLPEVSSTASAPVAVGAELVSAGG